jgi:trehalose synthase-fused probable maltokinase
LGTRDWLLDVAPKERWFADKTRAVVDVQILWQAPIVSHPEIDLVVAEYTFSGGGASLYLVPIESDSGAEATANPAFATWLLDSLSNPGLLAPGLAWNRLTLDDLTLPGGSKASLLGVEQSNTSIRYGDHLLIKLNRRLTIGPSPEVELAAVIAKAGDASFAARTHGALLLEGVKDESICLAICTDFVPNQGDAWAYLLSCLTDPGEPASASIAEIEQIADVTAAMHVGLTSDPWRREVSPEPIASEDIKRWEGNALAALEKLQRTLAEQHAVIEQGAHELIDLLPPAMPMIRESLQGFRALRGAFKTRTHGDYHLGQLLRHPTGHYVIVDLDGEPNRSLAERRDKYSPLRDVAGMLRSIAYARGTAERADVIEGRRAAWLEWEMRARAAYLAQYQERMAGQPLPLLPGSSEDLRQALTALELEKAIYECGYELSNRPNWLWLPLSRLVHIG